MKWPATIVRKTVQEMGSAGIGRTRTSYGDGFAANDTQVRGQYAK